MGNLTPCLMIAFSLFCVTMRGLESSLPTPLASAAVIKKSMAKFGDLCEKPKPLVGTPAVKLVDSGIPLAGPPAEELVGTAMSGGGGVVLTAPGLTPTCGAPLKKLRP